MPLGEIHRLKHGGVPFSEHYWRAVDVCPSVYSMTKHRHPASYPMGIRGSSTGGKAGGA